MPKFNINLTVNVFTDAIDEETAYNVGERIVAELKEKEAMFGNKLIGKSIHVWELKCGDLHA